MTKYLFWKAYPCRNGFWIICHLLETFCSFRLVTRKYEMYIYISALLRLKFEHITTVTSRSIHCAFSLYIILNMIRLFGTSYF